MAVIQIPNNPYIPTLHTVGDLKAVLDLHPNDMRILFHDQGNYLAPLHLLCDKLSVETIAGTTESNPIENILIFRINDRLMGPAVKKAGSIKSEKKSASSRKNGAKGGRPKQVQ